MNKIVKKILTLPIQLLPKKAIKKLYEARGGMVLPEGASYFYAQEGEDIILKHIFAEVKKGFYVDVGAHKPIQYSTTYMLYQKGWQGINIDPMPGVKQQFNKMRHRDINLEMGISNEPGEKEFYIFNEDAINTFDKEIALGRNQELGYTLVRVERIKTDTLLNILNQYADNKEIDYLNIDVEGHELDVLQQNDWGKYRPKVISVEIIKNNLNKSAQSLFKQGGRRYWEAINDLPNSLIHQFLVKQGYQAFAKGIVSVFYVDTQQETI